VETKKQVPGPGWMEGSGPMPVWLIRKVHGAVVVALLSLALFISNSASASQAASPVDMGTEPHHRLLLENAAVRVFSVTIPPHEESYVRQERNIVTVTLLDSEIAMWRQGESPVQHFRTALGEIRFLPGGMACGLRNDSTSEYRNITVEFKNPQVTNYGYRPDTGNWDYGPSVLDPPVDPHGHFINSLDLEAAVANDVQLLPKESLPASNPRRLELLIAITAADLDFGGKMHLAPGEVRWLGDRQLPLTNVGGGPARFVVVKIR
jgi:hypothetical protein